jgi:hypothetical protein
MHTTLAADSRPNVHCFCRAVFCLVPHEYKPCDVIGWMLRVGRIALLYVRICIKHHIFLHSP